MDDKASKQILKGAVDRMLAQTEKDGVAGSDGGHTWVTVDKFYKGFKYRIGEWEGKYIAFATRLDGFTRTTLQTDYLDTEYEAGKQIFKYIEASEKSGLN